MSNVIDMNYNRRAKAWNAPRGRSRSGAMGAFGDVSSTPGLDPSVAALPGFNLLTQGQVTGIAQYSSDLQSSVAQTLIANAQAAATQVTIAPAPTSTTDTSASDSGSNSSSDQNANDIATAAAQAVQSDVSQNLLLLGAAVLVAIVFLWPREAKASK